MSVARVDPAAVRADVEEVRAMPELEGRLLGNLADHCEALLAENESLRAENDEKRMRFHTRGLVQRIEQLLAENDIHLRANAALAARVAELEAGLKPFARVGNVFTSQGEADNSVWTTNADETLVRWPHLLVTVGDCRHAAALLTPKPKGTK